MPKLQSSDARVNEFRRMDGATYAMRAASDMLLLDHDERARALNILRALHETVAKETQANSNAR